MQNKFRIGCLSVVAYCAIMVLIMHFGMREGFFGAIGALSTLHGGNPDYEEWHGKVLDDITAPVQLPVLWGMYVCSCLADRFCRRQMQVDSVKGVR